VTDLGSRLAQPPDLPDRSPPRRVSTLLIIDIDDQQK